MVIGMVYMFHYNLLMKSQFKKCKLFFGTCVWTRLTRNAPNTAFQAQKYYLNYKSKDPDVDYKQNIIATKKEIYMQKQAKKVLTFRDMTGFSGISENTF